MNGRVPVRSGIQDEGGVHGSFKVPDGEVAVLQKGRVGMNWMKNRMREFLVNEDGPTATEYAVMLALIIIVALAAITLLGQKVNTIFTNVESQLPDGS